MEPMPEIFAVSLLESDPDAWRILAPSSDPREPSLIVTAVITTAEYAAPPAGCRKHLAAALTS